MFSPATWCMHRSQRTHDYSRSGCLLLLAKYLLIYLLIGLGLNVFSLSLIRVAYLFDLVSSSLSTT